VTARHSKNRPILGTTTTASSGKGHPITCHRRHRQGVDVQLYSFFNLVARGGWMVNATPRLLYPRGRTPLPTVPENGWAPGPVWAAMEKRKSLGPHRRSNRQRVALLKAPSWPLTRDSWYHRESDLKITKPAHVNRTGFMTPSSLPPTVPDV